jgi:signal transduction histidine kinase
VLETTAQLLRRSLGESVTIELNVSDAICPVLIDVSQLESALLNLAVNARDAMHNGGRLTIEASNVVVDGLPARKGEQLPRQLSPAQCRLNRRFRQLPLLACHIEPLGQQVEIAERDADGIIEVMREPSRQLADGFHLLRLP